MTVDWKTRLIHSETTVPSGFRSLATPVHRGSTTLFPNASSVEDNWRHDQKAYTYGLYGTPTTLELAGRINELERGYRTFLTPGGMSAIALVYLSFLKSGDHVLVPDAVYGPNRGFADDMLQRFGVEASYYPPLVGSEIAGYFRPNTKLVWCESPGSVTIEIQDVPAIAAVAHARGALVAVDNTYAAGVYFDAFAHGADVTMQALTKYVGGHSDLLLGSVTVKDADAYETVGNVHHRLGLSASPDDCSLALRGMKTLAVRLEQVQRSALRIANWLSVRPLVEAVLHPALPSCPGHEIWKRDFTGSTGLFSFVFKPHVTKDQVLAFVDALKLFEIGYSWGGVTSLALPFMNMPRCEWPYGERLVRLYVGLEEQDDLRDDLAHAFETLA